jgi:hypothetical protein
MPAVAGALLLIAMAAGQFVFHLNDQPGGPFTLVILGAAGGALVGIALVKATR